MSIFPLFPQVILVLAEICGLLGLYLFSAVGTDHNAPPLLWVDRTVVKCLNQL